MAGRVALVTGGSRGIGRACAVALAGAGHRVAITYARDDAGAAGTRAAVEAADGQCLVIKADAADPAAVDAAFGEVEAVYGRVQVLVLSAGINRDGLVMRLSDQQWDDVLQTNLRGAFLAVRRAAPGMVRARWGRIVAISSVVGLSGQAGQANYAASKAGLVGLTRSIARELGSRNVTANVVAPGPITTAMTDDQSDEWKAQITSRVPVGRFGTAEEVAAVVSFLCSDPAAYVSGAVVPVDGGLGMGH